MSRFLAHVENWIVILSFLVMVGVAFTNVITRYFFQASVAFTEELTINLLVVLTMIGAVVGLRERAHLGFSYLVDTVRPSARKAMIIAAGALICLFLAVLLWFGMELVINQAGRGRATPSLGIPQWIFTASIPLAGALGIFRCVQATREALREGGDSIERLAQTAMPVIDDDQPGTAGHRDAGFGSGTAEEGRR